MTNDDHRRIGLALGYPECCVDEWIADPYRASIRRGLIDDGLRSDEEILSLQHVIGHDGKPILDFQWKGIGNALHKVYIPCRSCMYGPNWYPHGYRSWKE